MERIVKLIQEGNPQKSETKKRCLIPDTRIYNLL